MNGEKVRERKWSFKRVAAAVLCSCMVLTSADMAALAEGTEAATDKLANLAAENLVSDKKGAYLTPDQEKSMVEEAPFGACALSDSSFMRRMGESVTMKVYAWSNQGALTYTWYHPMGYELESTTDTLVAENLQFGDESDFGVYTCQVSDGVEKKELKFNVNMDMGTLYAEEINNGGIIYGLYNGQKSNFSVKAKDYNNKEITYQWYRGTEKLEGETKSTCNVVHEGEEGELTQYSCIISNGESACKKSVSLWTMAGQYSNALPTYSEWNYYKIGTTATLSIDETRLKSYYGFLANKIEDCTFQWYLNDEKIEGATGSEYSFEVKASESASPYEPTPVTTIYCCEVSNGASSCKWNFMVNPVSWDVSAGFSDARTHKVGETLSLYPIITFAEGSGLKETDLSYQWYKATYDYAISGVSVTEQEVPGATEKVLSIDKLAEDDLGYFYFCRMSWDGGYQDSGSVNVAKYTYSLEQSAYGAYPGMEVTYSVDGVSKKANVSYQWYRKDSWNSTPVEVAGATGSSYTKVVENSDFSGNYYCVVTENGVGYETSSSYYLTRLNKDSAEWCIDRGQYISGAIMSGLGSNSRLVYYNRLEEDTIVLDPKVAAGSQAKLTYKWEIAEPEINSSGSLVPSLTGYKWEGLEETGSTYTIDTESLDNESVNYYRVTVSDGTNTQTLQFNVRIRDTLTVKDPRYAGMTLGTTYGLPAVKAEVGESVSFNAPEAFSTAGEVTYQWQKSIIKDNVTWEYEDIEGATKATYTIPKVETTDFGQYRVMITDGNSIRYFSQSLQQYSLVLQCNWWTSNSYSNYNVYPGQENVVLKANVTYEKPDTEITYKWEKITYDEDDNEIVELVSDKDTLVIDKVQGDCLGDYRITASVGGHSSAAIARLSYENCLFLDGYRNTRYRNAHYVSSIGSDSQYAKIGDKIPLVVESTIPEGEDISYQWYCNYDEKIEGATNSTYVVEINDASDYGYYVCKVTVNGETLESEVEIQPREQNQLKAYPAKSTSGSKEIAVSMGNVAQLETVAYCNDYPLEYQWYKLVGENEFEAIEGAKNNVYSLKVDSADDYATYMCAVTCKETDMGKTVYLSVLDESTVEKLPWGTKDPDNEQQKPVNDGVKPNPVPDNPDVPTNPDTPQNPGNPPSPETQPIVPTPVAVTGVVLDKTALDLNVGQEATLVFMVMPENAANKSVTWTSSNDAVVAVMPDGRVIAKAAGQAVINVVTVDGAKAAQCTVNVKIPATNIMIPKTMNLVKGEETGLSVTMLPAEATDTITWTSSKESVVKVSPEGKVLAVAPGTANIKATTTSGRSATCKVTVVKKKIKATKVTLSLTKKNVKCGDTVQLKATLKPSKSTGDLTWSSSNKKIATVDKNGVVTLKKPGKVTITVKTESGKKDTLEIDVKQPAKGVTFAKKSVTVKVDKTVNLKAKMTPADSTDDLKWSTSNKKIATVNDKGQVKGVRAGIVKITVKTSSGKKAECKVTVKKK